MATKTIADVFVPSHSWWADHEITEWNDEEGWAKIVEFESVNAATQAPLFFRHETTRDGLEMLVTYWPNSGQYTVDIRNITQ